MYKKILKFKYSGLNFFWYSYYNQKIQKKIDRLKRKQKVLSNIYHSEQKELNKNEYDFL